MSSPDTTTAAPSLPGNWVPSKAGCLNKNDWWIWSYDGPNNDARTVLGGPSQTNNCFPSTGDPTGTYAGSQCPPNYTRACPDSSAADAAVTCCPTADSTIITATAHTNSPACLSPLTGHISTFSDVPTLASTPLGPTASASSGDAPPPLPSETGSNQPPPSSGSHGLSAGASGGIGVGAGVGVLLLGLLAFFLYRRRRGTCGRTELPTTSSPAGSAAPTAMMSQTPASAGFVQNGTSGVGYGEQHSAGTYGTGGVSYWDTTVKHEAPESTPSPCADIEHCRAGAA
ncbi:hypothetical protein PG997_013971 [Apiospora hydei]|uniref:Uncharacterized protein n=1 Tax=Apiospora hydei TaxID=1337664 RepID=A0ABR1V7Q0_9PEZI